MRKIRQYSLLIIMMLMLICGKDKVYAKEDAVIVSEKNVSVSEGVDKTVVVLLQDEAYQMEDFDFVIENPNIVDAAWGDRVANAANLVLRYKQEGSTTIAVYNRENVNVVAYLQVYAGIQPMSPLYYEGKGEQRIENINLPAGVYAVTMTHRGDYTFQVVATDGNGTRYPSLVATRGNYTGTTLLYPGNGKGVTGGSIRVMADGKWSLQIKLLNHTGTTVLQGKETCTSNFFVLNNETNVIHVKYDGKENFTVRMYDSNGERTSFFVNSNGAYDRKIPFQAVPGASYCMVVKTEGEGSWTIDCNDQGETTVLSADGKSYRKQ